jgi:hypothetical protein
LDGTTSPLFLALNILQQNPVTNVKPRKRLLNGKRGVTDGTRTRNSQNHNLELYH